MGVSTQTFRSIPIEAATTQKIYNVTSPITVNTEFSQALTAGTKQILIRARGKCTIKFTLTSGESGSNYITIEPNTVYNREGLNIASGTLYMQVDKVSQLIEIEEWS